MKYLSHEFINKWVIIKEIALTNNDIINKFAKIGIYENNIIFVKTTLQSKSTIHLLISDVEYAIRIEDAKNILVELYVTS